MLVVYRQMNGFEGRIASLLPSRRVRGLFEFFWRSFYSQGMISMHEPQEKNRFDSCQRLKEGVSLMWFDYHFRDDLTV